MKQNKGFGKIVVILIIIIILLIAGVFYLLPKNKSIENQTPIVSNNENNKYQFPENIGNYSLNSFDNSNWEENCGNLKEEDVCIKTNEIIYTNGDKEIHIYPRYIIKGNKELVNQSIKEIASETSLVNVYRLEEEWELFWATGIEFDQIMIQFYKKEKREDGTSKYNPEKADPNNEVIKYFIDRYQTKSI